MNESLKKPTDLIEDQPSGVCEIKNHSVTTPMDLLSLAFSQGADLDRLEKLMSLQEQWEANQARKAFVKSLSLFKSESIKVLKDKDNLQYGSKYTSLGNLVGTVTPFLSKCDLSASWVIDQSNGITVTCILTHTMGHSESVSFTVPRDESGAKNIIQGLKSSITYAKGITFESICGLASSDANADDDAESMSSGSNKAHFDAIDSSETVEELQNKFTEIYLQVKDTKDQKLIKALIYSRDKKKKELRGTS